MKLFKIGAKLFALVFFLLCHEQIAVAQVYNNLINYGTSWKYLSTGADPGSSWKNTSFADAAWSSGNAELGYGDSPTTTLASNKIAYYFRKTIALTNASSYNLYRINLRRDDGIIVYVNGNEVYRNNMPSGTITATTLASTYATDDGAAILTFTVPANLFINGNNTIAAEVHNNTTTSSDLTFDLNLEAANAPTSVSRGPYLSLALRNRICIQWRTTSATNTEVRYGTSPLNLSTVKTNTTLETDHTVIITGLEPNKKYYYSIGTIGSVLANDTNQNFYTAPANGASTFLRFWITGDFGSGQSVQQSVRNAFTTAYANTKINGWIWLGDNAYDSGTDTEYQNYVFNVYQQVTRRIPIFPSPGNHDYGESGYLSSAALGFNFAYFNIFNINTTFGPTEKYYAFNYGNVHFISLDSYGSQSHVGSAMYNWLQGDLAANTQRWTVVYFHHPPYTKGTHNSDNETELIAIRNNIIPLLENYGVDVVLSGHSHTYERSALIKGHYGLESSFNSNPYPTGHIVSGGLGPYYKASTFAPGTVYAVCGTGGKTPGSPTPGYPHNAMVVSDTVNNGAMMLEVNSNALTLKYLNIYGSTVDQFTIYKTGTRSIDFSSMVTDPKQANFLMSCSPNPIDQSTTITLDRLVNGQELTLKIFDVNGALVHTQNLTADDAQMQLAWPLPQNIASGIYFISVLHGNEQQTIKAVKLD